MNAEAFSKSEARNEGQSSAILRTALRELMVRNEHQLQYTNAKVSFDSLGTMNEKLATVFGALAQALETLGLRLHCGAFSVFPEGIGLTAYFANARKAMTFISLPNEWKAVGTIQPKPRNLIILPEDDRGQIADMAHVAQQAYEQVQRRSGNAETAADITIFHSPYFVRKWERDSGTFEIENQVFQALEPATDSMPAWLTTAGNEVWIQRMLFTFSISAHSERAANLADVKEDVLLLLGSMISHIGANSDEDTATQALHTASGTLMLHHELTNVSQIIQAIRESGLAVIGDLKTNGVTVIAREQQTGLLTNLETLLKRIKEGLPNLSDFLTELCQRPRPEAVDAARELRRALEEYFKQTEADPALWEHKSNAGFKLRLVIADEACEAKIQFSSWRFRQLFRYLVSNTLKKWGSSRQGLIEIEVRRDNGEMAVIYRDNEGTFPKEIIPIAFRNRVNSNWPGGGTGNGIGLWAIGMALNAYGIPRPTIRDVPWHMNVAEFEFTFPVWR